MANEIEAGLSGHGAKAIGAEFQAGPEIVFQEVADTGQLEEFGRGVAGESAGHTAKSIWGKRVALSSQTQ